MSKDEIADLRAQVAALGKAREALEILIRRVRVGYDSLPQGRGITLADEALAAIDGVLNCNEISTPLTDEKGGPK